MATINIPNLPAATTNASSNLMLVDNGTITSKLLISNFFVGITPTITSPTLTSPTMSDPVLSGTATGTYTLGGTPTITSPTINGPTLYNPTITGTATVSAISASYTGFSQNAGWSVQSGSSLGYFKDPMGFVHMRGAVYTASVATYPHPYAMLAGYRPGSTVYFLCARAGSTGYRCYMVSIDSSGVITIVGAAVDDPSYLELSFDQICFKAA